METNQRALRHAAAQAFIESLDKLQEALAPEPSSIAPPLRPVGKAAPLQQESATFDLASLEQAVEDIEQFIQAKEETEN
jgi:hypothetical protein